MTHGLGNRWITFQVFPLQREHSTGKGDGKRERPTAVHATHGGNDGEDRSAMELLQPLTFALCQKP
ncbi:hypothetical protein SDJN02_02378, partial [Cucurbita argyrosperma subsp. argyrosperma]